MTRSKNAMKTNPAFLRCAVYTRKSTEEGLEQEFNSLDAQREAGEACIASQRHEGWTCLSTRYDDGGYSGGTTDRPALQRLMADIEAGKIDVVVVYKVDRLSRSLLDFAKLVETFDRHGVSFVSVTQQFNTSTSMGRLVLNVLLSFAQYEREIIGERIRDKISAQRRKGKWVGGVPVLGYDVDRSSPSPKLVVHAKEAARVREIFHLYLSLGSLLPVVDELERRGWRNKHWVTKKGVSIGGKAFDKSSLHALLTNPVYVGKTKHKKELFTGEHEAIITEEVFRRVQTALQNNGASGGARVRNRHGALLKGLLVCKSCGCAMTHNFSSKGDRRYRYYVCTQAIKRGRKKCASGSLPAEEIERLVVDQIRSIGDDPLLRAEVVRQAQEQHDLDLSELATEQRGLARELTWHEAETRRLSSEPSAGPRLAQLQERASQAELRHQEIQALIAVRTNDCLERKDIDQAFADFSNVWAALSPREQAQVLTLLVARVEFDAKDSTIAVTFHPSAIKSLAQGQIGGAA